MIDDDAETIRQMEYSEKLQYEKRLQQILELLANLYSDSSGTRRAAVSSAMFSLTLELEDHRRVVPEWGLPCYCDFCCNIYD